MSTAGIYNAWPSIIHGTEHYLHNQMKSHQAPFYFGGSQIPINLHPEPQQNQHHHMNGSQGSMNGHGFSQMSTRNFNSSPTTGNIAPMRGRGLTAKEESDYNNAMYQKSADAYRIPREQKRMDDERRIRSNAPEPVVQRPGMFSSSLMNKLHPPPTTAPSAPYPQPIGTGFFDDFMSGLLGGSINDPHTYRKHTTALKKSIGSNTYRLAKV